jgi:multidrug efflux system membrane fusion protein
MKNATHELPSPKTATKPDKFASAAPTASTPPGRTHWWVWLIVVLVAAGSVYGAMRLVKANTDRSAADAKNKRAKHDTPVVAARARVDDLNLYLTGLGTVTPFYTVNIRTRVDGQINSVNFKEGQLVKKGQVLLNIDPNPYLAALHEAQGQLAKDTALYTSTSAVVKMDTAANFGAKGSVSDQQQITDKANMDSAKAAEDADNASIYAAQVNLDYCTVKSPIDGRIGLRKVDPGNIVHAADTTSLAIVTQLTPIAVIFTLPEDDIPRVEAQVKREAATSQPVTVLAYDRSLSKDLAVGKLLAIDNEIDSGSGTVQLKAEYQNETLSLFPGQFVNNRLLVETVRGAVVVPSAAIQSGNNNNYYVYVVEDVVPGDKGTASGTVKMRNVTTGANQPAIRPGDEDLTVVTSGVNAGDVVVIDGVDKLIDGAKVSARITEPTTRPTAGAGATTAPSAGDHPHQRRQKPAS